MFDRIKKLIRLMLSLINTFFIERKQRGDLFIINSTNRITGSKKVVKTGAGDRLSRSMLENIGIHLSASISDIYIDRSCYISSGVKIYSANHDFVDLDIFKTKGDIIIGKNCWIGANSIILSGVQLGDRTVVAAGSVVTKSFEHGSVLIGGVPASIMKRI
jgi:UDP-3-O-[3-hydroxymyristoyl] glucosamine N-acyltransferase